MNRHSRPLLLDLFCGVGGAGAGYSAAGFEVQGVDRAPQPNYPFACEQADVLDYISANAAQLRDRRAVVHASPPFRAFSKMARATRGSYDDIAAVVQATLACLDLPYVIEGIPGSGAAREDFWLCGTMFNLSVYRHRSFEVGGWIAPLTPPHASHSGVPKQSWSGYNRLPGIITVVGHTYKLDDGRTAMGIPWATSREELNEATPPAYTQWIGRRLLAWMKAVGRYSEVTTA